MIGCVGAIDGLFVSVNEGLWMQPTSVLFWSYMAHGLNIEAICDSDRCFTFFGVIAPGKTSDQVAFERTSIHKCIMALPMGMYVVDDAAYQVSDVILVPFTGSQCEDQGKDAFTFFLLQQRICIEMALLCFKPSGVY